MFTKDGVDPILHRIKQEVSRFVGDVSTAKGRGEVASMAHKVARSKTLLDDLGKNLVADWKAKSKVVDDSRKKDLKMINVSEDEFEDRVFPKILANERLCRIYLQELKKTGVTFSEEIHKLSHEDCINIAIRTYAHIKVNERRQRKEIA